MKVSIIVPVYNVEQYLTKCLDSLVNQTLQDIEIIVVNDGSPDNSQRIIDKYVSHYPNKVISLMKENGGLSDARNFALPYCKGEYIGFIDSDDYVDTSMYEKMYEQAKRSDADVVMCDYYIVYGEQRKLVKAQKYNSRKEMFFNGLAAAWNKIYKKSVIDSYGIQFPKAVNFEDTEFYCKLIPHVEKADYVGEPFVYYVQRSGSIANTISGPKTMHMEKIWRNIVSYYQSNHFYDTYKEELEYFSARILLGSHLLRISRIPENKERSLYARKTLDVLTDLFPDWRKNKYLKSLNARNIFLMSVNIYTIGVYAAVLNRLEKWKVKMQ